LISSFSITPIEAFHRYDHSDKTNESLDDLELIRQYTTERYQTMNELLQDTINCQNYHGFIHNLNRIIRTSIRRRGCHLPKTCFRLTNFSKLEFRKLQVGSIIYFPTFVCCSRKILNTDGNTLFIIKILEDSNSALDLSELSAYPSEQEILIGLNIPFRVIYCYEFGTPFQLRTEPLSMVPIKQIVALSVQEEAQM